MFSAKKIVALSLALAGPGFVLAQSTAQMLTAKPPQAAVESAAPVSDVYVQQQLDWRSYYLHRIDGSRTEGRTDTVPDFRHGV